MAIAKEQIDDLRERADLVSIVGRRLTLRRSGRDFKGLCPFHGEKSPSFYVVPSKHLWNCFGCGEKGDVFKFLMKLDGLSFVQAAQAVAGECGVVLTEADDPEEKARRIRTERLGEVMERAVKFYEKLLWAPVGQPARTHLVERGITDDTARRFGLGFAGVDKRILVGALQKAGVDLSLAIEAGLCTEPRGRWGSIDRFHGRLIIPIRTPKPPVGKAVALGGRHLPAVEPETSDRKIAKYINSPESPLYHKSSVLFGLDHARDPIRRAERAVVVEGYFDVIGLHQAGFSLAVASCGTSLTAQHLDTLGRLGVKDLVFLFDGDAAGIRAATRAGELCVKAGVSARVATLPHGQDPDEFVRSGGLEALERLIADAPPALDVLVDQALGVVGADTPVEHRIRAVEAVRPLILAAPEGLRRTLYIGQVAQRLSVPASVVEAELEGRKTSRSTTTRSPSRSTSHSASPRPSAVDGTAQDAWEPPSDAQEPPFVDESPPPRWREPGSERLPSRPRDTPQRPADPQESQVLDIELPMVACALRHPPLVDWLAENNIVPWIQTPLLQSVLRQLAESRSAGVAADPAMLVLGVPDPALQRRLWQAQTEVDESPVTAMGHLRQIMHRYTRVMLARMNAQIATLQASGGIEDPAVLAEVLGGRRQLVLLSRSLERGTNGAPTL